MSVFKLDQFGMPFAGNNEFHYQPATNYNYFPVSITYGQSPGLGYDEGLHMYAYSTEISTPNYPMRNNHFIESYFNGVNETGCTNWQLTNISNVEQGPVPISVPVVQFGGFTQCPNQLLLQNNDPRGIIYDCSSNSTAGGNNSRQITSVGESSTSAVNEIYPIPSTDYITISGPYIGKLEIINSFGQVLSQLEKSESQLTIKTDNLLNGVYFIRYLNQSNLAKTQFIKH